jgi:hypothetical protein
MYSETLRIPAPSSQCERDAVQSVPAGAAAKMHMHYQLQLARRTIAAYDSAFVAAFH